MNLKFCFRWRILHSIIWLHKTQPPLQQNIRCLADNKYIVDAINDQCKTNINHIPYVNKIKQYKSLLINQYNLSFDWIPGHTANPFHRKADKVALDPLKHLAYFTDAQASMSLHFSRILSLTAEIVHS